MILLKVLLGRPFRGNLRLDKNKAIEALPDNNDGRVIILARGH